LKVIIITALLFLWNLLVIHVISKWFYTYFIRFEDVPAVYVGRKIVHILGGGVTALLIPRFYEGFYWIVSVSAWVLAGYIYYRRKRRPLYWFQVQDNAYEVHFSLAYGTILLAGMLVGDIWVGLIPTLFMSFGDSATGLVRAFTQRKQVKSWDGTVAMMVVCSLIGYWKMGWYGLFIGIMVSLVEKIPNIDDNLTVPALSALLVWFGNHIF
jgi:dolichol kinase